MTKTTREKNAQGNVGFPGLGFQGKIFVYCVFALSITFLIKSLFFSSARFNMEVFLIS
jgi:hypothetical protein